MHARIVALSKNETLDRLIPVSMDRRVRTALSKGLYIVTAEKSFLFPVGPSGATRFSLVIVHIQLSISDSLVMVL